MTICISVEKSETRKNGIELVIGNRPLLSRGCDGNVIFMRPLIAQNESDFGGSFLGSCLGLDSGTTLVN